MKFIFKIFLKNYLRIIAKIALAVHQPLVIAIAGSTNKSFTKERISKNLRDNGYVVRSNIKSFNTDIGLPLAALSLPSGYGVLRDWLPVILKAPSRIFDKDFPEILVVELGISNPGDMKYLLTIIKPRIAVLTNLTQRYLEGFADMDELAEEYEYLADKAAKTGGLLISNADNSRLRQLAMKHPHQITFGFDATDCKIKDIALQQEKQIVKVEYLGSETEHRIGKPGIHHVYALCVSLIILSNISKIMKK